MKKIILTLMGITSALFVDAQAFMTTLDINNVSALIRNDGILFESPASGGVAAYEVPRGSNLKTIFAQGLWCSALNDTGSLHLAAMRFGQNGNDFFPGPVSSTNAYMDSAYLAKYVTSIWTVSVFDIQYHLSNYMQPGYVYMSQGLKDWPANGDASLGLAQNLAPFVDNNNNGIYEPMLGEYPDIRGHQATYVIMNDTRSPHTETGGVALGIEIHLMAYQYASSDYLDNTTFLNYRIYNRGTNNYANFKLAQFTDFDIGNGVDDYIGCDSTLNLMYGYNGDNTDQPSGSSNYGTNPPAAGLVSLNHDMKYFAFFTNGATFPYTDPNAAAEYYNFMNGLWANGSQWYYGGTGSTGTIPTNYMFSGNPNDNTSWNELSEGNPPGDRRGVMTLEDVNLPAGGSACYDFAVLYARDLGNDYLQNVNSLIALSSVAKTDFNNMTNYNCNQITLGLEQLDATQVGLFPNPTTGEFTLSFGEEALSGVVAITDLTGKVVFEDTIENEINKTIEVNGENGIYHVLIQTENGTVHKKIVLSK